MDEAKSITLILISVIISITVIGAAARLIEYSNETWSVMQRQETNNKAMADYAMFAAFDNTEVRGNDIISLIDKTKGYPAIIVKPQRSTLKTLNGEAILIGRTHKCTGSLVFINPDYYVGLGLKTSNLDIPFIGNASAKNIKYAYGSSIYRNVTTGKAYKLQDRLHSQQCNNTLVTMARSDLAPICITSKPIMSDQISEGNALPDAEDLTSINYQDVSVIKESSYKALQNYFLNRGKYQWVGYEDKTFTRFGTAPAKLDGYSRYKSELVYENNTSSEVVAIVFYELQGLGDIGEE